MAEETRVEEKTVRKSIVCTFGNHAPIRFWGEFKTEKDGKHIDDYVDILWDGRRDFGHHDIEYYTCKSGKRIYFSSYNSGETCGSHEPRTTRTYLKDVEAIKAYFGEIDQMNEWYCVSSFQCSTWIGVAYLTLIGLLLSVYRVCGSGLSLREVARRERRMKMRYEIEEEDEGGRTIASISVKSERSVRQEIKKWIKADPSNLIFVSWYRTSDGQKGYFNPSGDHDITGKTWEIGQ